VEPFATIEMSAFGVFRGRVKSGEKGNFFLTVGVGVVVTAVGVGVVVGVLVAGRRAVVAGAVVVALFLVRSD
jgi:hypothetical protein